MQAENAQISVKTAEMYLISGTIFQNKIKTFKYLYLVLVLHGVQSSVFVTPLSTEVMCSL